MDTNFGLLFQTSTKPILKPMKFLQLYASSQTLNSPTSHAAKYENNSPSSSAGATSLGILEPSRGELSRDPFEPKCMVYITITANILLTFKSSNPTTKIKFL